MPFFLAGLALLLLLLFGARLFASADTRKLAMRVRKAGGIGALIFAALLLFRGLFPFALPLAVAGLALLGFPVRQGPTFGFPFGGGSTKSPGQTSSVRTETVAMVLDHDSGRMEGEVLKGQFAGRLLSSLTQRELVSLLDAARQTDGQAAALLEAFLDWRFPDWRENEAEAADGPQARPRGVLMDRDEAYAILGVEPGASEETIRQAHRNLMKKLHPDQGGSNYLAARINEAKEVLLGGK